MPTTLEGGGKEASVSPAPADLLVGIESMQNTYTGFFSGAESGSLPQEVKDKQQEFDQALLQMQTLATKLAGFQQTISKAIAKQKPPAITWAGVVGNSAGSTGAAVPGGTTVAAGVGGEGTQTSPSAEGSQTVEQNPLHPPPAALAAAARTTSPDRGAGGEGSCTTTSSLVETKLHKDKRAEDCSFEELMQRRPQPKVANTEVTIAPMERESLEEGK